MRRAPDYRALQAHVAGSVEETAPSAESRPAPGRSRVARAVRVLLIVAVPCLILSALFALALISARSALLSGEQEINQARRTLSLSSLERNPTGTVSRIQARLSRADADFRRADDRLRYLEPVLTRLSWVPVVGDQVAAAPAAARLAHQTAAGALSLLNGLHPLTADPALTRRGRHVSTQLALKELAAGRSDFQRACGSFHDAASTRARLSGYRSAAVRNPLRLFDRELPRLQVACQALILVPGMLGLHRPATYLVAYQNPAQLRASGGFIGSAGLLTLRDGRASQHFIGTWIRDNLSIPPPEPVALYNHEPGWLFRDSNWSPDFPTTASLERFFAALDLHWHAPDVIDVTPQATADALTAMGPFYSPEYHRWISGKNVAQLTDFYTHHSAVYGPLKIATADDRRKQFIQIVAQHLFSRVAAVSPAVLVRLGKAVADDLTRGDILLNFQDPVKQHLLELAGATGAVNRDSSDYLYVVDSNLSYNKVNPYVHLSVDYHVRVQPNRWLEADVTLHFRNLRAPHEVYADSYGPGAGRAGSPADYSDFVRILVPAGAALIDQSGWVQPWSPGTAYGKTMFSGYVIVRVGKARDVHLRYVVPPNVFSWSRGRAYRLLIQHQPGSNPDTVYVAVSADGKVIADSARRHPHTDRVITASIEPRPYQPVPLPGGSSPIVAPGHWIEPHAYLGWPTR